MSDCNCPVLKKIPFLKMDGSSQKLILRKKPVRLKEWMAVNYCSLEINE